MLLDCNIVLSCKNFAGICTKTDLAARVWATHSPWKCLPAHRGCCNQKHYDYGREVLFHAPYNPDIIPRDFHLFPKLKEPLRGQCFSSLEEPSIDVIRAIRHMNKHSVLDIIILFPKCSNSVIQKQGNYIEGLWTDNLKEMVLIKNIYRMQVFWNILREYTNWRKW